jgi:hypothetical protein
MKQHDDGTMYELAPNEVFVFGSNGIGSHAAGAAKIAHEEFGYPIGVSTGLVGQAYGIDTMGRKEKMKEDIDNFIDTARQMPAVTFYLTRIGCGIAGYTDSEVALMFSDAPSNVILPSGWAIQPTEDKADEQ